MENLRNDPTVENTKYLEHEKEGKHQPEKLFRK